jgi:hypothetical protein
MNNNYYQEYKKRLAIYSECMKPIIQTVGESFMTQTLPSAASLNLDEHCIDERKELVEMRNLLKGSSK